MSCEELIINIKKVITSISTLESVIDVGQGISIGPGRFGKKNKRRAGLIFGTISLFFPIIAGY